MPHIKISLMPKAHLGPEPSMPSEHLKPQDPYVQMKMSQGPGFGLKPPPIDTGYLNELMGHALPKP
jgi:hypothetical protein